MEKVKEFYPFEIAYNYFMDNFKYDIHLEGKDKIVIYDAELKLTSVKIDNPNNKREDELEINITLILLSIINAIENESIEYGKRIAKKQFRDFLEIENCKCND